MSETVTVERAYLEALEALDRKTDGCKVQEWFQPPMYPNGCVSSAGIFRDVDISAEKTEIKATRPGPPDPFDVLREARDRMREVLMVAPTAGQTGEPEVVFFANKANFVLADLSKAFERILAERDKVVR